MTWKVNLREHRKHTSVPKVVLLVACERSGRVEARRCSVGAESPRVLSCDKHDTEVMLMLHKSSTPNSVAPTRCLKLLRVLFSRLCDAWGCENSIAVRTREMVQKQFLPRQTRAGMRSAPILLFYTTGCALSLSSDDSWRRPKKRKRKKGATIRVQSARIVTCTRRRTTRRAAKAHAQGTQAAAAAAGNAL